MHAVRCVCDIALDIAALESLARRQVGHSLLICADGESCDLKADRKRSGRGRHGRRGFEEEGGVRGRQGRRVAEVPSASESTRRLIGESN